MGRDFHCLRSRRLAAFLCSRLLPKRQSFYQAWDAIARDRDRFMRWMDEKSWSALLYERGLHVRRNDDDRRRPGIQAPQDCFVWVSDNEMAACLARQAMPWTLC